MPQHLRIVPNAPLLEDMLVVCHMGKTPYVVWYVGGMVRWYGVVDILLG
ncbi:MAG: hypothetical protein ABJ056_00045 [Halioglobus sp.]